MTIARVHLLQHKISHDVMRPKKKFFFFKEASLGQQTQGLRGNTVYEYQRGLRVVKVIPEAAQSPNNKSKLIEIILFGVIFLENTTHLVS